METGNSSVAHSERTNGLLTPSSSSLVLATPSSRELQFLLREVMTDKTRLPDLVENQLLQTPKHGTRRKGVELQCTVR